MEKWAFYNSLGQIIKGASGAWLFYNAAGEVQTTLGTGGGSSLTVQETDGSPIVPNVITIRFNSVEFTVVNNGGGVVTINLAGSGGLFFPDRFFGPRMFAHRFFN